MIYERAMHEHAFGPTHPLPGLPSFADPLESARYELTQADWHGRTIVDWLGVADAQRLLALRAPAGAERDLTTEVARLATLAGVPLDGVALLHVARDADTLAPDVRAPFANLVGAVADAYEAQLPLAREVSAAWPTEWNERTRLLTVPQREAMALRADDVVAAMLSLSDALDARMHTGAIGGFRDPLGLVVLGTSGNDVHARDGALHDPVVLVDPAGDDVYLTTAGGACPDVANIAHTCNGLALSVLLDLEGADSYHYDGGPAAVQGAGSMGGMGLLVDLAGDDAYSSLMTRDARGPVFNYVDGGAQGFSQAGYGLLLDAAGDDSYQADVRSTQGRSIWDFAQGFGSLGGIGLALDAGGNDKWFANGLGLHGNGFQGVYNNGVGFYGGIGINADTGAGNDVYRAYNNGTTVDYYAQGFGAFGGLGILFEDGGDDDYTAVEIATDPFIIPLLNCAFGTGSLGGAGIFLELAGNDRYYGASGSPRKAYVMNEGFGGIGAGYGMFVDVSGDDGHFMENLNEFGTGPNTHPDSDTFGRGVLIEHVSPLTGINTSGNGGANRFGNYLDLGGTDTYVGAPPSRNDARWSGGADIDGPVGLLQLLGVAP